MFVKFVIIVVFGLDSFFWHHDSQKNAFIFVKGISLLKILKCEISDDIEIDWDIGSPENLCDAVYDYECKYWLFQVRYRYLGLESLIDGDRIQACEAQQLPK